MKLLVLAGGYGTRLYPLVKDTPKALLEVAGRTLIDHTLDKFLNIPAISEVAVVTNSKFASLMNAWASARKDLPFPVRIIDDGTRTPQERLGAIGDILFVLDRENRPEDWLIVGSDNLFDQPAASFVAFAQGKGLPVIGAFDIRDISNASQYGVIELCEDGTILSLEEKPQQPRSSLISMCLYYLPKDQLHFLHDFIEETHTPDTTGGFIQWLFKKTAVYGFKFSGTWYDIGSINSYNEAHQHFSK